MKICGKCKEEKPLADFHKKSGSRDGYQNACKPCRIKQVRQWQIDNADRYKTYYQKYQKESRTLRMRKANKYGLTLEQLDSMIESADGKCTICGREPRETLVIDHCHAEGHVRGLLCEKCNAALGLLDDNIEYLKSAIEYLNDSVPQ